MLALHEPARASLSVLCFLTVLPAILAVDDAASLLQGLAQASVGKRADQPRLLPADEVPLYMPAGARSRVAKFCVEYSDFWWEDCGGNLRNTTPGAMELYAEACEAAFAQLDAAQRAELEPLLGESMSDEVRYSFLKRGERPWTPRMLQIRQLMAGAPPRREMPQVGKSTADFLKEVEHLSAQLGIRQRPPWLDTFEAHDLLGGPVRIPMVKPESVLSALQAGEVSMFDATQVLPRSVFNASVRSIAELHTLEEQRAIPYLSFAERVPQQRQQCLLGQYESWRKISADLDLTRQCPPMVSLAEAKLHDNHIASRINARRLPRYFRGAEATLATRLGLDGVVQRGAGNLIVGEAVGGVHWDEPDNIFIALSGITVLFLVPANRSQSATDLKCKTIPWDKFMQQDDYFRNVLPYHFVVMRPGDGIVIPSGALHAVYGDKNRLSLNTFMEPKFKRMRWAGNPASWWHQDSDARQALRNLWVQSLGRVWDTKKVGLYTQGAGMEYM